MTKHLIVASTLFSVVLMATRAVVAQIFTATAWPESRTSRNTSFATVFIFLLCLGLTSHALAQTATTFTGKKWSEFEGGATAVCDDSDIDNDNDGLIELCYLEDLDTVRNVLNGSGLNRGDGEGTTTTGCASGGCIGYELVRDLDFNDEDSYRNATANMTKWTTGTGWLPIGDNDNRFSSIFEGNGHTLTGLTINRATTDVMAFDRVALFGALSSSGVINGVGLLDGNVRGIRRVGSFVGRNNGGILSNSYNTGKVRGVTEVGGLIGSAGNNGTIANSYNSGQVQIIESTEFFPYIGGLVGTVGGDLIISNSYNSGLINGHSQVGGFFGRSFGATIRNSYNRELAKGVGAVGSLVGTLFSGRTSINNFYSIGPHPIVSVTELEATLNVTNSGIKTPTELQAPTGSTGIYSVWSEDDWDFGTAIQYPAVKYTAGTNANYLACGTSQQPACGSLLAGQRTRLQIISTATDVRFEAVEGEMVVLDATRTTGNVTYEWKQTRGTAVSYLSTTDSAVLEFAVPLNVAAGSATATETLVFQLTVSDDSVTTVSIVVYDDSDDGQIVQPTVTRLSARGITVSVDLASDPDGAGAIEAYQWQICSPTCSQWDNITMASTGSTYQIPAGAMEGNQFRVQLTYRDGQNYQTTRNSTTLTYVPLSIADIDPIATTEGEVVTIVAEASVIFDGLSYVWRATTGTGDKTPSILEGSKVTSPTLMFTVPDDWASMAQTTLHLFVSVSDGETTSTNPVIVNITRIDNGRLTTPTIIERDLRLTVSADLSSDSDGVATIETYQWQLCRGSSATVMCNGESSWMPAPGTPTTSSYMIQESDAVVGNQFRVQLTYRDGQNYPTTVTSKPLAYAGLRILDIAPIATTEGEVVEIVAMANVSAGDLSYVWRATTGDKTPSILEGSSLTSSTLMFTVPNDWADTPQTTLNLFVSVGDGETTPTNRIIVNITRTDNGGLATIPTITETERELTVSADLTTDPDGSGTVEAYQWQLCRGSSATVVCDNEGSWMPAPGTPSTASSYTIQESDAVVGNQFRVQLTYRDGQGYSRTVVSEALSYGEAKAIFIRLKLFLEGALQ